MHGEEWNGSENLQGWWMTEKMDGVRAYWNGGKLISKQGKEISCPNWFIEELPKEEKLDGELWMGRKHLEDVMATLNSNELWKNMKYVLFDKIIGNVEYEKRIEELTKMVLPSHVSVVEMERCLGNDHLIQFLDEIMNNGGEGIVVTKPKSNYIPERT
jgi:DNA ligase-1